MGNKCSGSNESQLWRNAIIIYTLCTATRPRARDPCNDFPGGSDGKASAYNAGYQVHSLGWEDHLEMEMATHSSILVWKITWMEEPSRL